MKKEKIENLLAALASRSAELPRPELAQEIKEQIPHHLARHRRSLDTINIIIDLRISKFAAAAVIILAMVLMANLFASKDVGSNGIIQDSRMLISYFLSDKTDTDELSPDKIKYKSLIQQGIDVVHYGSDVKNDTNSVIMHWRLDDGQYDVMFGNLNTKTVSAAELIKLQTNMLKNRKK